jgi:UDP:flavonoid glycosyltransferase YjiC (YdhE family)
MGSTRHVLFLSRPDEDHLYRTLAVAEELGRRGHRVTFATSDPFAEEDAESGVLLVRYGRDVANLRGLPAFAARVRTDPVDLVVCDPRTHDEAAALAREWGVEVVVAHAVPGSDHLYVHPGGRGTVFGEWAPADSRLVLAVSPGVVPAGLLAAAFGERDWQVVVLGDEPDSAAPQAVPHAVLEHADVVLTDGELTGGALRHATPVVLVPRTPAQHRQAIRLVTLGLGVVVPAGIDAAALCRTVSRLAVDEPARAAARRARDLVRAAGSPARASDALEARLAEEQRKAA